MLCTVHYRQSMVQSMHKNSLFTSVSQCWNQLLCFGVTLVITLPKRHARSFKKSSPEKWIIYTYINVRSRGKQFCFPENQTSGLEENKINWFPKGLDIKCFVIFLDFHFSSNKRITGANQNSPLGNYNNTNLILKTTEYLPYIICIIFLH